MITLVCKNERVKKDFPSWGASEGLGRAEGWNNMEVKGRKHWQGH
jgi:hypothetical protein